MHSPRQRFLDELLERHLRAIFGDIDTRAMKLLRRHLEWMEIAGGETLMRQGDEGDAMYFTVSGRLRAYVRHEDGTQHMVGEMSRGHMIGEMSLYTGEPRAATVVAVRDSVLVRLAKPEFNRLLARSARVSITLTRQIIQRLKGDTLRASNGHSLDRDRPVTMALLPITAGIDLAAFGAELAREMARIGRVQLVTRASIDAALAKAGLADSEHGDAETTRRIALVLDEIESQNDFVLLVGDDGPSDWTRRCCRHCDELLLLADADQPPVVHPTERECLAPGVRRVEAAEILVLLHPSDRTSPRGTPLWLARRPVAGHLHIRPGLRRDMARMARIQSRTAVGLVLAGGGARGFAHLGVYRALRERGIEIDCVGGTSMGAVMATYIATDQPLEAVMRNAREAFRVNPTGDFNLMPVLSLIKGLRLRRILAQAVQSLVGYDADEAHVEDLWKGFYCVATNYSTASEYRIEHGNLVQSLLASTSIPGALPPVIHQGELLCDGGIFNNFPVDAMRRMRGVGRVIGVDLNHRTAPLVEHLHIPGTWALLRDRLRRPAARQYRLPSLPSYLMTVTILNSMSRQRAAQSLCDLYFHPPLTRVGMLQWNRLEPIIQRGYAHALQVLDGKEKAGLGVFDKGPA